MKRFEFVRQAANADLIVASIALLVLAILGAGWWTASHPAIVKRVVEGIRQQRFTQCCRSLLEALSQKFRPEAVLALALILGLLILWLGVSIFGMLENLIAQNETALFDGPLM